MRAIFTYLFNPNMKVATKALADKYQGELDEMLAHEPYKANK